MTESETATDRVEAKLVEATSGVDLPAASAAGTSALDLLLAAMVRSGHGWEAITCFLGVGRCLVELAVVRLGLVTPHDRPLRAPGPRGWSAADTRRLIAWRLAGIHPLDIAARLNRSVGAVRARSRRLGVPTPPRSALQRSSPQTLQEPGDFVGSWPVAVAQPRSVGSRASARRRLIHETPPQAEPPPRQCDRDPSPTAPGPRGFLELDVTIPVGEPIGENVFLRRRGSASEVGLCEARAPRPAIASRPPISGVSRELRPSVVVASNEVCEWRAETTDRNEEPRFSTGQVDRSHILQTPLFRNVRFNQGKEVSPRSPQLQRAGQLVPDAEARQLATAPVRTWRDEFALDCSESQSRDLAWVSRHRLWRKRLDIIMALIIPYFGGQHVRQIAERAGVAHGALQSFFGHIEMPRDRHRSKFGARANDALGQERFERSGYELQLCPATNNYFLRHKKDRSTVRFCRAKRKAMGLISDFDRYRSAELCL